MERITEIFNKNGRAALVVVVSLRDRAVVIRVPSPNAKVLPPKIVVDTYLELLTTAALPFEPVTAPPARLGRDVRTNAGAVAGGGDEGSDVTSSSVASIQEREPWHRMSLKTRQWDIEAVRQEITDDMMEGSAKGQVADHWMMISFCDVSPSSE